MQVYITEDNELIREAVQEYFEASGYQTAAFGTLAETKAALEQHQPEILLLDVMLPDGNGFLFARELRTRIDIPIVFLTARDNQSDRILGFEVGGDDYVVKPFSNKELLLRVKAVLKRGKPQKKESEQPRHSWTLQSETLTMDQGTRKIFLNAKELQLTNAEWQILSYLARRPEQAIAREQLLANCLGYQYSGSERTIDTHIAKLRHHLGAAEWIETVWGCGYRFAGKAKTTDS